MCIVQKRDSGVLYAMKYVSRSACESRGALGGVLKEVELLSSLEHPFLVNLWFSFQGNDACFLYAIMILLFHMNDDMGQINVCITKWMKCRRMYAWMDEWIDGWVNEWIDGWVNEWIDD